MSVRGVRRVALAATLLAAGPTVAVALAAPPTAIGRAFPQAERLFRRDPRWLGSDAALSVPLAPGRVLWLFGDTFVATSAAPLRARSTMVRNSIAVQSGDDPRRATVAFHWGRDARGAPGAFFPGHGERWYWPGHGLRLAEGPLVLFLYSLRPTPGAGLGFASAGAAVAWIDDPDAPVERWRPRIVDLPPESFDALPATAVVRDGPYVVALAIRQAGTHAGALVRWPAAALARGELAAAEWWAGEARGWRPAAALGPDGPVFVIDDAGAECSLHRDARTGRWVHLASYGFGASTIGLRTAPALTGPWSAPVTVYRPPEADDPRLLEYAAKAHPELIGPHRGDLVVTYATNSHRFEDLIGGEGERSLYWPRFVTVSRGW